jgi:hypothetical protein
VPEVVCHFIKHIETSDLYNRKLSILELSEILKNCLGGKGVAGMGEMTCFDHLPDSSEVTEGKKCYPF